MKNCNDPIFQGYSGPLQKCIDTVGGDAGGVLPFTGASLAFFVVGALILVALGAALATLGRRPS